MNLSNIKAKSKQDSWDNRKGYKSQQKLAKNQRQGIDWVGAGFLEVLSLPYTVTLVNHHLPHCSKYQNSNQLSLLE